MCIKVAFNVNITVDGDLICIYAFNEKGQLILQAFKLNNICADEVKWIDEYIQGEYESNSKLKLDVRPIYQLYKTYLSGYNTKKLLVNKKYLSQFILNASIAKKNIGSATLDIWALTIILQCYQKYCEINNYKYIKDGKVIANLKTTLSFDDIMYLNYVYTRLVQDRVIEAIKHIEEGSASFKIYFLQEMSKRDNIRIISKQLYEDLKVDKVYIDKLLNIIAFASHSGLLKASRNFISIHNKGNFPHDMEAYDKWKDFIQEHSYFGQLMSPLFDIVKSIEDTKISSKQKSNQELDKILADLKQSLAS